MAERAYATTAVGLEQTSSQLKGAKLSLHNRKPQIDKLFHVHFDSQKKSADSAFLKEQIETQLELSRKTLLVTSIDASETLIRPLEIKLKKDADIDAVLAFQAEPLLPYPPETALLDRIKISQNSDGTLLTLLAIKKEHIQKCLQFWKTLDVEPEMVTTVPSALVAFSRFALQNPAVTVFILHVGEEQTSCTFAKEGKLVAAKAAHYGVNSLKTAFRKESGIEEEIAFEKSFSSINWSSVDLQMLPQTAQKLKDFGIEIEKLIYSLMKQARELEIPPLLITGEGTEKNGLMDFLLKGFQGSLHPLSPVVETKFSASDLKLQAIPIGEALTAFPGYPDQVNFLQAEFTYPHPWKRLMKPLATFLALCLGLAVVFYFFGQAYLASKENVLRAKYAELLGVMHKTHDSFEQEFSLKNPEPISGTMLPLESLSQNDIAQRVDALEKELKKVPDLFPLTPNVPKVSDILAWLSTHSNIVGKDGVSPLISIEGFNYVMVKRPELNKKQEKYQVKIEMDFTSANATAAREFHDALLQPNHFIDPKAEVKWVNNKGRYRATFMLKDRTVYP